MWGHGSKWWYGITQSMEPCGVWYTMTHQSTCRVVQGCTLCQRMILYAKLHTSPNISKASLHTLTHCTTDSTDCVMLYCPLICTHMCQLFVCLFVCLFVYPCLPMSCVACFVCLFLLPDCFHYWQVAGWH